MTDQPGILKNLTPYSGTDAIFIANGEYLEITYTGEGSLKHGSSSIPIKDAIFIANGECLEITHIGEGSLKHGSSSIPLKNVLVVPEIKRNLLSVAKSAEDNNCYANGFQIKDMKTSRTVTAGSRKGSLYAVDEARRLEVLFSNSPKSASEDVWHRRTRTSTSQSVKVSEE